jgi:hypothetical protein
MTPLVIEENYIDLKEINIDGIYRVSIIKDFIKKYTNDNSQICVSVNKNKYKINYNWFDTITTQSYEKLYYNKIRDGMIFSIFDDNGYPYINIELGNEMVINYINKFFFYNEKKDLDYSHLELILEIGRIFYYKKCIIFHNFNNFATISSYKKNMFLYTSFYNKNHYDYIQNKIVFLKDPFITYELGYWKLDDFLKKIPNTEIIKKIPKLLNSKTNSDLIIKLINNDFYLYTKLINNFNTNIFTNCYVIYNIYEKLSSDKRIETFNDIKYTEEENIDEDFKAVFRQPIRRL